MKRLWIGLIFLLALPYQLINSTVEVKVGNIFTSAFVDEYESIYFIFRNGDFYNFTTRDKERVQINVVLVRHYFMSIRRNISDIVMAIHNHPSGSKFFSDNDVVFNELMREYGFRGTFLLYANGKVYMY